MKNNILTLFIIVVTLLSGIPTSTYADSITEVELGIDISQNLHISMAGRILTIISGQGETLCVYNLVGDRIMTIQIDQQEKHIDLSNLPRGIYPIKIGRIARKISLQ